MNLVKTPGIVLLVQLTALSTIVWMVKAGSDFQFCNAAKDDQMRLFLEKICYDSVHERKSMMRHKHLRLRNQGKSARKPLTSGQPSCNRQSLIINDWYSSLKSGSTNGQPTDKQGTVLERSSEVLQRAESLPKLNRQLGAQMPLGLISQRKILGEGIDPSPCSWMDAPSQSNVIKNCLMSP